MVGKDGKVGEEGGGGEEMQGGGPGCIQGYADVPRMWQENEGWPKDYRNCC